MCCRLDSDGQTGWCWTFSTCTGTGSGRKRRRRGKSRRNRRRSWSRGATGRAATSPSRTENHEASHLDFRLLILTEDFITHQSFLAENHDEFKDLLFQPTCLWKRCRKIISCAKLAVLISPSEQTYITRTNIQYIFVKGFEYELLICHKKIVTNKRVQQAGKLLTLVFIGTSSFSLAHTHTIQSSKKMSCAIV